LAEFCNTFHSDSDHNADKGRSPICANRRPYDTWTSRNRRSASCSGSSQCRAACAASRRRLLARERDRVPPRRGPRPDGCCPARSLLQINPEVGIVDSTPRQASCGTKAFDAFGVNEKCQPPFLDLSGERLDFKRRGRMLLRTRGRCTCRRRASQTHWPSCGLCRDAFTAVTLMEVPYRRSARTRDHDRL
jgi:hypothetical protein